MPIGDPIVRGPLEMRYRAEVIQVAAVAVAMIEDLDMGQTWRGTVDATLREVREEREAQEDKWGTQHHTPMEWLAILGEEFGEACRAALESHEWAEERHRLLYEAEADPGPLGTDDQLKGS